jgi:hypothetical protein
MRLVPCPHCDHHTWSNERACPHCGGALEPARARRHHTAAALLLGLAACTSTERPPAKDGDENAATPKQQDPPAPVAEPEYGVPEVPVDSIPEAPAYGAPPTDEPPKPPDPVAEPEYGVPISETPK